MHIMTHTLQRLLTAALCAGFLVASNSVLAEVVAPSATEANPHAQHNKDWPGNYLGYLPCKDCHGIKSTLALNTNHTYVLITQEMGPGKSPREYVEKGSFEPGEKPDTLVLTARKTQEQRIYAVDATSLTQLDEKGNKHTGADANRYVLRRNDAATKPQEHSGH